MGPVVISLVFGLAIPATVANEATVPTASPKRMEERIQALSRFGANPEGGVSRVAFSEADIGGREYVKGLMREAGLAVRVDTAGNVIGGIEVAQLLHENKVETRYPLEVAVFTDEEGGLIGSLAMVDRLDSAALDQISHSGMTRRDGVRAVGGDPERIHLARRKPGDLEAFIELHIEQGAFLHRDR